MKKRQQAQRSRTRSKIHLSSTGLILALGLSCHSCTHLPATPVQEAATRLEDFARELGTALRERADAPTSKSESLSKQGVQTGGANSFAECPQFFAEGRPPVVASGPTNRELCFDAFAILHSGESKTPVFVAQKLNRASVKDAGEERTNRFYAEARLRSAERATLEDYKTSGYDRGHMAPAGDMPTPRAMAQSFSLANMVPQASELNRGVWAKSVEMATRKSALRAAGDVYVITGPVYEPSISQSPGIGPGQVRVPKYLFKLVYDESKHRVWAHWHLNDNLSTGSRPVAYGELVRRTGIEFLLGVNVAD